MKITFPHVANKYAKTKQNHTAKPYTRQSAAMAPCLTADIFQLRCARRIKYRYTGNDVWKNHVIIFGSILDIW